MPGLACPPEGCAGPRRRSSETTARAQPHACLQPAAQQGPAVQPARPPSWAACVRLSCYRCASRNVCGSRGGKAPAHAHHHSGDYEDPSPEPPPQHSPGSSTVGVWGRCGCIPPVLHETRPCPRATGRPSRGLCSVKQGNRTRCESNPSRNVHARGIAHGALSSLAARARSGIRDTGRERQAVSRGQRLVRGWLRITLTYTICPRLGLACWWRTLLPKSWRPESELVDKERRKKGRNKCPCPCLSVWC